MEYMKTIPRIVESRVRHAPDRQKSVLLLGPRQTGKTTLVKTLKPDLLLNFLRQRYGSATSVRRICSARKWRRSPRARAQAGQLSCSTKCSACPNW
jgi:hypothetical protein